MMNHSSPTRLSLSQPAPEPDAARAPASAACTPTPVSTADPVSGPSPAAPLTDRLLRAGRVAWPAIGVYGATATLHFLLLAWMNPPGGPGIGDQLVAWDGQLYIDIAAHGYPDGYSYTPEGELTGNNLAFFPLFPLLTRVVHHLTGLGYHSAGIVTAHLALLGALITLRALLTRLYGPRTATIAIILLAGAQPMALTFFMAYSESLLLALAAATLLAAHRHAWITAGVLALLGSLTRPAGVVLVGALAVAAFLSWLRERRVPWRPVVAVVLACSGVPLYLLWVGWRVGSPDAWFVIQAAGWDTRWDNGASFLNFLGQTLTRGEGWVPVSTAILLLFALLSTVVAWQRTAWPPLFVYGAGILVLTLGQSNYFHSKLRLLIPAVVFLIPAARALARARPRSAVMSLAGMTLFGCWFGAYMLTTWEYAI
jgi:hypothetical protein